MIFYVVAKIVGFASVFSRGVWEGGWCWKLTLEIRLMRLRWGRGGAHLPSSCNQTKLTQLQQSTVAAPPSPHCLPANDIKTITLNIIATIWRQRRHSAAQPDTSLMSPGQTVLLLCQDCCMLNVDCSCDALLNAFMPHKRTGNQLQGALRRR